MRTTDPGTPKIKSVIDLGTNTVLMVTGRVGPEGTVEILDDAHAIARLGQGVDARRRILPEAIDRVCKVLQGYRERARALGAEQISAHGTSALRDAANKAEFIARVRQATGIDLTEVPGAEEARLTFAGAGFGLDLPGRYAVLDIGGGSTELAIGTTACLEQSGSVNVGAVRLTERFFPRLPPTPAQREAARSMILSELGRLPSYPDGVGLVGVAGTASTLGAMDKGLEHFDAEELNGHFLNQDRVEQLATWLLSLPLSRIRQIPQVHQQRADIIGAGALILQSALQMFRCPGLTVSTRGIRYGLLVEALRAG